MVTRRNANGPSKSKSGQTEIRRASSSGGVPKSGNQSEGTIGDSRLEQSEYYRFSKEQLKSELKKRGWKTTGNRAELLQRLDGKKMASTVKRKTDVSSNSQTNGVSSRLSATNTKSREEEREERENLVLWRHPITTINYFCRELCLVLASYGTKLMFHRRMVALTALVVGAVIVLLNVRGPHQVFLARIHVQTVWCAYWLGLGVLSSVGLGTGLHTFLLYLGPHIASVTIAAYECGSLNFPEPPYPDEIVCPEQTDPAWMASVWNIMSKVRLEAMMWGAGTALGELPPYFMARAARLSGYDPDDEEDLQEFEDLQRKKHNPESMTLMDRAKWGVEKLVQRVGFFGILACASIPNPLFDLAGITCGHFLVPFWTFFGATLIGKAVIKMHIQKLFVIIAFNETLVDRAVSFLALIPGVGSRLQAPFKEFLVKQKQKLHRKSSDELPSESSSMVSWVFEKFVIGMILYFVVSIVNSLAQSHHKRIHKRDRGHKRSAD